MTQYTVVGSGVNRRDKRNRVDMRKGERKEVSIRSSPSILTLNHHYFCLAVSGLKRAMIRNPRGKDEEKERPSHR